MKKNNIEVKTYNVLEDCVSRGIDLGYKRAHKHTDKPEEWQIFNDIQHYIMLEISEYFRFPELEDND